MKKSFVKRLLHPLCIVGAIASFLVFPPHHDEAERPFSVHGFLHNAHLFEKTQERELEGV